MIQISHRLVTGLNLGITMPDPDKIACEPVRIALDLAMIRYDRMNNGQRELQAAVNARTEAVNNVRTMAREAAIAGEDVPTAHLRQSKTDAEAAVIDAELALAAFEAAYTHAWQGLVAAIEANKETWRATLEKDARRALNLMAAARKSVETADAEATAVFGVLSMFEYNQTHEPRPVVFSSPQTIHISQAMPHLTDAIGSVVGGIEKHRG